MLTIVKLKIVVLENPLFLAKINQGSYDTEAGVEFSKNATRLENTKVSKFA